MGIFEVVIQTLTNEDQVGEAEIDCKSGDGGHETSPEGASEVGDVADEPDDEEGERYAFGGALLVVLYQLGDLVPVSYRGL